MERPALICKGELLLSLRYFRNYSRIKGEDVIGELLLGLRYFRNTVTMRLPPLEVNYYLDCGTSETRTSSCRYRLRVNYYLIYGTSETFFTFERSDLR